MKKAVTIMSLLALYGIASSGEIKNYAKPEKTAETKKEVTSSAYIIPKPYKTGINLKRATATVYEPPFFMQSWFHNRGGSAKVKVEIENYSIDMYFNIRFINNIYTVIKYDKPIIIEPQIDFRAKLSIPFNLP